MIFDILMLLLFCGMIYAGYRFGTSKEMLNLAKVFIPISLASAFSGHFGMYLTRIGFLRASDWAVLTLTGFLLLFIAMWIALRVSEYFFIRHDLRSRWFSNNRFTSTADRIFCATANGLQAVLLLTFFSFLSTQISLTSAGYKQYLMANSLLYPSMDRICRHIVTGQFVDSLINDPTGTTTFEVLVKTLNNKQTMGDISDEFNRSTLLRARSMLNNILNEESDVTPPVTITASAGDTNISGKVTSGGQTDALPAMPAGKSSD